MLENAKQLSSLHSVDASEASSLSSLSNLSSLSGLSKVQRKSLSSAIKVPQVQLNPLKWSYSSQAPQVL